MGWDAILEAGVAPKNPGFRTPDGHSFERNDPEPHLEEDILHGKVSGDARHLCQRQGLFCLLGILNFLDVRGSDPAFIIISAIGHSIRRQLTSVD